MEGTGWREQYLVDQGIIQNNTMGGGSLSLSVLQVKNTECRICRTDKAVAGVQVVDIKLEEKTITNGNNQLLVLP